MRLKNKRATYLLYTGNDTAERFITHNHFGGS